MFCGSRPGNDPAVADLAKALAHALVGRGHGVVFGGGSVGLMGILADEVLAAGGEVIGVMPKHMVDREVAHAGTQLHIVDTMHTRKALMYDLSDAVIALPGGYGTLDELFEVLTWNQLGLHAKPAGLLDHKGYFAPLVTFLDGAVDAGFIPRSTAPCCSRTPIPSACSTPSRSGGRRRRRSGSTPTTADRSR